MCGIIGIIDYSKNIVNDLYRSLFFLQHRGQHSSGFVVFSTETKKTFKSKKIGLISEHIDELKQFSGNIGLGHVRYPTNGLNSRNEIQPFTISKPYGISLVHNGNIINKDDINNFLINNKIYINSTSDSEIILNLFYYYMPNNFYELTNEKITECIKKVYELCHGSFSIIIMISDYGIIGFRDKYGIRPLSYTKNNERAHFSSETNALEGSNFIDIKNGEVIIINTKLEQSNYRLYNEKMMPCIFEYIYFANAESYINNILVYKFRELVGEKILEQISEEVKNDIDLIIPVPMTSIISAKRISEVMNKKMEFAIVKNRYTHRTFINQGEDILKGISKIKVIHELIKDKSILIVDDSIVRGNTCNHIIKEIKKSNPKKIYFASCSPPIKYPNCYGISIPTFNELIAYKNDINEIRDYLGIDELYYLNLESLRNILKSLNSDINTFEESCFTGKYISY